MSLHTVLMQNISSSVSCKQCQEVHL